MLIDFFNLVIIFVECLTMTVMLIIIYNHLCDFSMPCFCICIHSYVVILKGPLIWSTCVNNVIPGYAYDSFSQGKLSHIVFQHLRSGPS